MCERGLRGPVCPQAAPRELGQVGLLLNTLRAASFPCPAAQRPVCLPTNYSRCCAQPKPARFRDHGRAHRDTVARGTSGATNLPLLSSAGPLSCLSSAQRIQVQTPQQVSHGPTAFRRALSSMVATVPAPAVSWERSGCDWRCVVPVKYLWALEDRAQNNRIENILLVMFQH